MPLIRRCCDAHSLQCDRVKPLGATSNAVFRLRGGHVIKFFVGAAGQTQYECELEGLRRAAAAHVISPMHMGHGRLSMIDSGPPIPFVIATRVRGDSLRNVLHNMALHDMYRLAMFLGASLRRLHDSAGSAAVDEAHAWSNWLRLMVRRRERLSSRACVKYMRKALSASAFAQIDAYLPGNPLTLFVWDDKPCFLHGDLNNENVLMAWGKATGAWLPSGIIDFGDSVQARSSCAGGTLCCHSQLFRRAAIAFTTLWQFI